MCALGAFTFVLHSHLPYARLAGRWPHGEEWIHEAAVETYIPLLETLYDLKDEGIPFRLTFDITPILAEQLTDPSVIDHLDQYLDARIAAAERDLELYSQPEAGHPQLAYLAGWYKQGFDRVKTAFNQRFNRDIIGAFRVLQDEGLIEIITSAATHAYLPLLNRDSSLNAQFRTAVVSYRRMFGRDPSAAWLPECGYRPAYISRAGHTRPGLEYFLNRNGLKLFFSETHTITGGQPVGIAAGDVLGPYGEIKRRYVIPPMPDPAPPERQATTFLPYYVPNTLSGTDSEQHSQVAVIGRNNRVGQQVWSAEWGYPADFDYREFHRKAGTSGLQYWRITGSKVDLGQKDFYHPDWASYKVDQHAEHFVHMIGDILRAYHHDTEQFGVVAAAYDTELFGHWWYEGVSWLGKVLRHLASDSNIAVMTASQFIDEHPPQQVLSLPESSWGAGGGHFVWDNNETHWMWPPLHEAERRMEQLVARYPTAGADETLALNQAARELLLAQSSDWPFLVTTHQAREYAIQRFSQHLERFNKLADGLEAGAPDVALTRELWELDRVFPDIDYRWFAEFEG